jgi:hypothetical protein
MKVKVGDWSTKVEMSADEAKEMCKLGQGEKCCAFLVMGKEFECIRMSYPMNGSIFTRLEDGTMNAKGKGEWEGCFWYKK